MSHAEKCPVCYGAGKLKDDPDPNYTFIPVDRVCHGCGGKGWVVVEEKEYGCMGNNATEEVKI